MTPIDISSAIKCALSMGVHKLQGFRQHKLTILRRVVKLTLPINAWVLANSPRKPHVIETAGQTNVVLLAAFSDATTPDRNLVRDFLYGFQLTGFVESSMMHREIDQPDQHAHDTRCAELEENAWDHLVALEESMRSSGPKSTLHDRQALLDTTSEQVAAGLLARPFTRDPMLFSALASQIRNQTASSGHLPTLADSQCANPRRYDHARTGGTTVKTLPPVLARRSL